jgi:triosephosphate isomerase (TIM)
MHSRAPLVAGNWKMNGRTAENERRLALLRDEFAREPAAGVDVVVCPAFPYLGQAAAWLRGTSIVWGAQDVSSEPDGARTGEVSTGMLGDLGCSWAIVGHSERRSLLGEDDSLVGAKAAACVAAGIGVIACVGESLDEREAGLTEQVLARQLAAIAPALCAAGPGRAVLAYEPVWAIGTGRSATPDIAQQAHAFLRQSLARNDPQAAASIRIVYGGSVKAGNAPELFDMPDVDGGLIGGASLDAHAFAAIARAAVRH